MGAEVIEQRNREIEAIELSEEEREKAIWNYKVWKWNDIRNREYWQEQEAKRPKQDGKGAEK